mgnify:CR=1 FL=1
MQEEPLLTLVLPIYNEAENLATFAPHVVNYSAQQNWKVIFVDDGSTDDSLKILNTVGDQTHVSILRHKINRGYGAALKSGLAHVSTPFAATMDADGQHRCEDISHLFECANTNQADLVIGSRGLAFKQNWLRGLGKWLIRTMAKMLFSFNVKDLNSGIKVYRTTWVQRYLSLCPDSMAFSDVVTLIFAYRKHLIKEIPIQIQPRQGGSSSITLWTAIETLLEILNAIVMLNPLKIFGSISLLSILVGVIWGGYLILRFGRGVSVGSMLAIVTGLIFFTLGLLAHQISALRLENSFRDGERLYAPTYSLSNEQEIIPKRKAHQTSDSPASKPMRSQE